MSEPRAMTETCLTHSVHRYAASLLTEAAMRSSASTSGLAELRDGLLRALHRQHQTEDDELRRMITAADPGLAAGLAALSGEAIRDVLRRRLEHGEPLLFPALGDAVRWAGAWLVTRRVRAGDVVALCAPDSIEFVATRHMASWTGLVLVTLSPLSPHQETSGRLFRPGARCLVMTSQQFVRKPEAAAQPSPVTESLLLGPDGRS
jgi:hypothetical protein